LGNGFVFEDNNPIKPQVFGDTIVTNFGEPPKLPLPGPGWKGNTNTVAGTELTATNRPYNYELTYSELQTNREEQTTNFLWQQQGQYWGTKCDCRLYFNYRIEYWELTGPLGVTPATDFKVITTWYCMVCTPRPPCPNIPPKSTSQIISSSEAKEVFKFIWNLAATQAEKQGIPGIPRM